MTYKLDGAKFQTLDELVEALYPMYSDEMSEEELGNMPKSTPRRDRTTRR